MERGRPGNPAALVRAFWIFWATVTARSVISWARGPYMRSSIRHHSSGDTTVHGGHFHITFHHPRATSECGGSTERDCGGPNSLPAPRVPVGIPSCPSTRESSRSLKAILFGSQAQQQSLKSGVSVWSVVATLHRALHAPGKVTADRKEFLDEVSMLANRWRLW